MKLTKAELLKAPVRPWDKTDTLYDWILLVPGKTKHDSGYMHQVLIGVTLNETGSETYEILGWPDDIEWIFPAPVRFGDQNQYAMGKVRTDCYYPQGVFRFHSGYGKFHVSTALSSMTVSLIES